MYLKKEYIILILIIIALSTYLILHKENKTQYTLPGTGNFKQEEISKLTVTKTTSGITLAREDDRWFIEPQHFPADSGKVDNMLNAVSGLKLTALVSESGNHTIYELDNVKRIQVRAFHDDTSLLSLDIGKPASSFRHTFVRLEHDHRVFHAEGNLRNIFDTTVSMLRDKDVLTFDEQVAEIYLKKGNDTLRLVRRDAPVSVDMNQKPVEPPREPLNKWLTADGQAVHDEEVDSMLSTLKNLTCDEFIEERKKEDFTDPVYTITLKGLKEYTVSFFNKTDGKYPAFSSESDYPFFLSDWKAEKIMKEFADLTMPEEQR